MPTSSTRDGGIHRGTLRRARAGLRPIRLLLLVGVAACSEAPPPQVLAPPSAQLQAGARALPSLRFEVATTHPVSENVRKSTPLLVGPGGELVFVGAPGEHAIVVRRASGTSVSFGPWGDGPGEIRSPWGYGVTDSLVVIVDMSNQRLSQWTIDGSFVNERRVVISRAQFFAPLDGQRWLIPGRVRDQLSVGVLDGETGGFTAFDLSEDVFFKAHWPGFRESLTNPISMGAWYGGFVLGDGRTYSLGFFDWSGNRVAVYEQGRGRNRYSDAAIERMVADFKLVGRTLSPVAKQRLRDQSAPWFSIRIRKDGLERTWLVGEHDGSAFADVFIGPDYLGRLTIPCVDVGPNWDLQGEWLAVVCKPDDPASMDDFIVKLFRIVSDG
jgi:hypothetical protein